MIQLTVLYGQPKDSAAFDRYYREVHAPLTKKLPGLKGYSSNKPTAVNPQEPSPYYLIDTLYFESIVVLTQKKREGKLERVDLQRKGKDHAEDTANLYGRI